MSNETNTKERRKNPFVMFPDNMVEDKSIIRLRRKGGFEYMGLFFQLCFMLHRYREDGLEASMPLDMDDADSLDDLVYLLSPMEKKDVTDAIGLMTRIGLLETFEQDGVKYICAPIMREAVLNIKDISRKQSERRRGRNRESDPEDLDEEDSEDYGPEDPEAVSGGITREEYLRVCLGVEGINTNLRDRFWNDVVLKSPGAYTKESIKPFLEQFVRNNSE